MELFSSEQLHISITYVFLMHAQSTRYHLERPISGSIILCLFLFLSGYFLSDIYVGHRIKVLPTFGLLQNISDWFFLKNGLYKILKLVEVRGWCKLNISVAVKTPWQYLGIGLKRSYIWKSYNTRVATLKWITSHLFPLNFKFSQASHQGRIESELI